MEQPSKNETTVHQNSPDARSGRMSLAAYLAAGVGLAGITGAAEAAIVNIDLTDTRGDGPGAADNISGVNAGLSVGGALGISDWLGVGTGTLYLIRDRDLGSLGNSYIYWGLGGGNYGSTGELQFALQSSSVRGAKPRNFAAADPINATAQWSPYLYETAFKYFSTQYGTFTSQGFAGNYMGFRFGSGANYNYGWLQVNWNGTSENWQILSGAYETTVNTAIAAGQGAASVPAPSPASLLALIVGGAALRQWRRGRRKQQLLEQTAA